MKKNCNYIVGFLVLTILTILNLWYVSKNAYSEKLSQESELNKNRILSLFNSSSIIQRKVNNFDGIEIISNSTYKNVLSKNTIIIMLAEFKCSLCQKKELIRLNNLLTENELRNISVIGITTNEHKTEVAIQSKLLKLKFPIYSVDDETFFKKLAFAEDFPQLLLISDGIVISAFQPITLDDEFSEIYYNTLLSKLFDIQM